MANEEKFSREKLELLKEHLRDYKEIGEPIEYEILVDGFKAVRRTSDPELFDRYERFINRDTKELEIHFFTGTSNYCDKRRFILKETPEEKGLSGTDIDQRIQEGIDKDRKVRAFEELEEKNKELAQEVQELESEVEKLENELSDIRSKESPFKGVFGEIGSVMIESFVRRNPQVLAAIPGAHALSGFMAEDQGKLQEVKVQEEPELQVSFRAKDEKENQEAQEALRFVKYLKGRFAKDQFNKVITVIDLLADAPEKLDSVICQLNIKEGKENGSI